ncbi:hypothetical protein [Pleionea sediminis]|uniref:hypothetical protein n=1 Tax=Pleionea sediminis TaxID=2569479 RepID=UPI0011857A63|nr:hypothetical protein [Pleionea sediminis]
MLKIINAEQLKIPDSPQRWLEQLDTSTIIEFKGQNSSEWRVLSVLIHGNEPSGFFAVFEFLKNQLRPTVNLAIIISSVRAARHPPYFTHRFVPGEFDLNRRFGVSLTSEKVHDGVTELATEIIHYIQSKSPSLIVDLHNTSGNGPEFAVSVSDDLSIKQLASVFTKTMVITHLVVGSLMEQNFNCPIVTIECGGAQNSRSHKIAYQGLVDFAQMESMPVLDEPIFETYYHPFRIEARSGVSLDYGEYHNRDVDITLRQDIERFNFTEIEAGTELGWINRTLTDCIQAKSESGEDVVNSLFSVKDLKIIAKRPMKLFMATCRADIAVSDCLFYSVNL